MRNFEVFTTEEYEAFLKAITALNNEGYYEEALIIREYIDKKFNEV